VTLNLKAKKDVRGQIKKYLGASGVSQVWLSNRIGMNPSTLSVTLNEKRILQAEEFFLICDALNVSYDYFKHQNDTIFDYDSIDNHMKSLNL